MAVFEKNQPVYEVGYALNGEPRYTQAWVDRVYKYQVQVRSTPRPGMAGCYTRKVHVSTLLPVNEETTTQYKWCLTVGRARSVARDFSEGRVKLSEELVRALAEVKKGGGEG